MKRIRLQAQVVLWHEPGLAIPSAATRPQDIIKMCVPCLDSHTIQQLADKIVDQWARVYVGYGPLDIKELQTVYGEPLDMGETVDAYFDDRKDPDNKIPSDQPPSTSIIRVVRFPPDPREVRNIVRFGSLMPESTARPRKRPHANSAHNAGNSLHAMVSIEEPHGELPNEILTTPNKRQRTQDARVHETAKYDRPSLSQWHGEEDIHIASQTIGTQGSVHQVYDSQQSPAGKASNPYGTPTSLSLVSSQEPIPRHQLDITSIPDSPTSRRVTSVELVSRETTNCDRQQTKSESPEIRLSIHDVPALTPQNAAKRTHTELLLPDLIEASHTPTSSTHSRYTNLGENVLLNISDSGVQQRSQAIANNSHSPLALQEQHTERARCEARQTGNGRRRTSHDVFDVESDPESIPESQRMHSAKSLKLGLTATEKSPSPHAQSHLSKDRRDGHFLVPQIPNPRQDGAETSVSELAGPNKSDNVEIPTKGIEITNVSDMEGKEGIPSPDGFGQLHAEASNCHRSNSKQLQNEGDTANGRLLGTEEPAFQGATVRSQVADIAAKNWSHLDVEHPLKQALSQGRRPDFSILPNLNNNGDSGSNQGDLQAEEEEPLPKGAEEQRGERARERKASQRRVEKEAKYEEEEVRRTSEHRAEERGNDETRLAESKNAEEEKVRVGQLAEAEKKTLDAAKHKEEEAAGWKAAQEAQAREKRPSDKSRNDGKTVHEQVSKEKALVEEAEKTRLRQDGAHQLKFEELQKQKTLASSSSKGAAAKTPGTSKHAPRTEEQRKQRRETAAAKREAEQQAKAAGKQTTTQIWAESLFSGHLDMDLKAEDSQAEKVKAESASQDIQKLRNTSAHRSSSPSGSSSNVGKARKSMTPVLPHSTVTKSSSARNSPMSSSPLASRSSVHLDTPLRSALKNNQSSSALRRSVSFVSDQGKDLTHTLGVPSASSAVKPYVSSARPAKTLVDTNNELALPASAAIKASRKAPVKDIVDSGDAKADAAKKEMVQHKLNVTRNKKLKDRALDPPLISKAGPKEEIVVSSSDGEDSDSASSSEADMGHGQAKAGLSSRKKHPRALPRQESVARFNLRGTPIDPVIENMGSATSRSAASSLSSRSNTTSEASSQQKSVSRSPAQAMSETIFVSSGSTSGSQSESETESRSGSDSESVGKVEPPAVRTPSSTGSTQRTATESSTTTTIAKVEIKPPDRGGPSDQISRQSEDSSNSVDAENADDKAAGQQLQLECSQPAPTQISKTVPSPGDETAPYDKLLNQGLNRDGRLPDGTRPAYFMYPKLSTLRKLQEKKIPEAAPSALRASQTFAAQSPEDGEPSNSSSDESSSSSDENENVIVQASLSGRSTSSKSKPGGFTGLRGVMKRKPIKTQEAHVC